MLFRFAKLLDRVAYRLNSGRLQRIACSIELRAFRS